MAIKECVETLGMSKDEHFDAISFIKKHKREIGKIDLNKDPNNQEIQSGNRIIDSGTKPTEERSREPIKKNF